MFKHIIYIYICDLDGYLPCLLYRTMFIIGIFVRVFSISSSQHHHDYHYHHGLMLKVELWTMEVDKRERKKKHFDLRSEGEEKKVPTIYLL